MNVAVLYLETEYIVFEQAPSASTSRNRNSTLINLWQSSKLKHFSIGAGPQHSTTDDFLQVSSVVRVSTGEFSREDRER